MLMLINEGKNVIEMFFNNQGELFFLNDDRYIDREGFSVVNRLLK